jgi:putative transcriptional regulator
MTSQDFKPSLLLSMPQMQDPNFARTVVLLCDYGPDGAFGLVVNRPTDMPANQMVRMEPPILRGNDLRLYIGGPVQPERGWILVADQPDIDEYRTIQEGLHLSSSPELLRRVLEQRPAPRARVIAGYAGWGPGQLDEELAQSAWLIGDVALDLIFDVDEYRTIQEGLHLSSSPELLRRVLEQRPAPRARVIAGYAGWGPGQLDEELAQSAWLIGEVDLDLIFDVEASTMWDAAIRRLGADPSALQSSHGVH